MRRRAPASVAICCGILLALSLGAGIVRADADPASDLLLTRNVSYPFGVTISDGNRSALEAAVTSANAAGLGLKVAIVGRRTDLGSIPQLYRQPQNYARFLGMELLYVTQARVLVVMPNGFGLSRHGRAAAPRELAAVQRLAPAGSTAGNALVGGATRAVDKLLSMHGIAVTKTKPASSSSDRVVIAVVAAAALVIAVGGSFLLRRSRPRAA